MQILSDILLKFKINFNFLTKQKWGILKPNDPHSIPKYLLKKYLINKPIIIDCGAHIGSDSIELAKIFPKSEVYSFEPVPILYEKLQYLTRTYKNIKTFNCALSNTDGEADFYLSSGASDASSSLLEPNEHLETHPDVNFNEKIIVKTFKLDTWALNNNITKVDFLWLDMQGFELDMLKASTNIFPTVKLIHTEVSIKESYKNSVLYSEYKEWLFSKGFHVVLEAIPENTDMGNVLFEKI